MEIIMHPYLSAWLGGVLIGIACVAYLYTTGKVVGVSGMIARLPTTKVSPALWFLLGILLSALLARLFGWVDHNAISLTDNYALLVIAGVLVGVGTRLGSGCTSGHGICGISRLSLRSMVATVTFIAAGMLSVAVMRGWGLL